MAISAAIFVLLAAYPGWRMWHDARESARRHALFSAIRANNASEVAWLLESGANANLRDLPPTPRTFSEGFTGLFNQSPSSQNEPTPLLAALYTIERHDASSLATRPNLHPNVAIIQALLDHGADANAVDISTISPLGFAALAGSTEAAHLLLQHGARVDQKDVSGTPLSNAAGTGRVEMVRFLLANGADINATDFAGYTPLLRAVRYTRQPELVRLLLAHHANVNARDRSGKTALFFALNPYARLAPSQTKRLPEIVALLQNAGAK